MGRRITPDMDEWHDKSFRFTRPFTCEHCGTDGHTGEADALCEECGRKTLLAYEEDTR